MLQVRWNGDERARQPCASGDAYEVGEVQVLPLDDDELDLRTADLELVFDTFRIRVPDHIIAVQAPHLLEHGKPRRASLGLSGHLNSSFTARRNAGIAFSNFLGTNTRSVHRSSDLIKV